LERDTAVLIVDVQVGLLDPPDPARGAERLLTVLADLIERARDSGVPVIYVQHSGSEGSALERETAGWRIHTRIEPRPGDWVVEKSEPDSFQGTDLDGRLRSAGIKRLVIGGMLTEYCVDTTVRSAFSHGYTVILLEDGHATSDSPSLTADAIVAHHNRVLGRFAEVKKAREVGFP
jgi:nicotinamidase-related amidase